VGPFELSVARTLDELAELDDPVVLPLSEAIRTAMPVRELDESEARALSFGRSIAARGVDGTYGVLLDGRAIALVQDDGSEARPLIVFAAAG
jgi:tRNA pseudouridine55 synthase